MRVAITLLTLSALGLGCSGGGGGNPTPTPTPTPTSTPTPTPTPQVCTDPKASILYAVDETGRLLTYNPAVLGSSNGFGLVGTPGCAPGAALAPFVDPAVPHSLTVDRQGGVWMLYTSGEIFLVNSTNASCTPTSFTPQQMAGGTTWSLFGMGFVTDTAGGSTERIWISGGSTTSSLGSLGHIDPATLGVTRIGALGGSAPLRPDLMGVSDATLWGYFPDTGAGFVQQIDRTNGAMLGSPFPLPAPGAGDSLSAWGAGQWGGKFHIFLTTTDTNGVSNSTVRTIERANGNYALVTQNLPFLVVAAGSGTCAPP